MSLIMRLGKLRDNFAFGAPGALPCWSPSITLRQFTVHGRCACAQVCRGEAERKLLRVCENSQKKIWQLPILPVGTHSMLAKLISCTSYQPLFIQDTKHGLEPKLQVAEVS